MVVKHLKITNEFLIFMLEQISTTDDSGEDSQFVPIGADAYRLVI